MKKKTLGKIVNWLLTIVILIMTVFVATQVIFARVKDEPVYLFDYTFMIVVSDSMTPEIGVGDFIVAKKVDIQTLVKGDNAVFVAAESSGIAGQHVVHKVIKTETVDGVFTVTTKGLKAGAIEDTPFTAKDFLGKQVWQSAFIGKIIVFFSYWLNWVFIAIVCVLSVLILRIIKYIKNMSSVEHDELIEQTKKELRAELLAKASEGNLSELDVSPDEAEIIAKAAQQSRDSEIVEITEPSLVAKPQEKVTVETEQKAVAPQSATPEMTETPTKPPKNENETTIAAEIKDEQKPELALSTAVVADEKHESKETDMKAEQAKEAKPKKTKSEPKNQKKPRKKGAPKEQQRLAEIAALNKKRKEQLEQMRDNDDEIGE